MTDGIAKIEKEIEKLKKAIGKSDGGWQADATSVLEQDIDQLRASIVLAVLKFESAVNKEVADLISEIPVGKDASVRSALRKIQRLASSYYYRNHVSLLVNPKEQS